MINVNAENGFEYPLGTIILDGEVFDNIGYEMLQTANAMTYSESPERSNTGEMHLEDMDSFIVPRCQVGFKLITIEKYIAFRRLLLERKEHTLNYFDIDFGERVTHKMYVEAASLQKFFAKGTSVIGVQNYSLEFIGLLNEEDRYTVEYDENGGSRVDIAAYSSTVTYSKGDMVKDEDGACYRYINSTAAAGKELSDSDYWELADLSAFDTPQTVSWGEPIMVDDCSGVFAPPSGKSSFLYYADKVNADGSMADGGWKYYPGQSLSVFRDTTLYAIWE